MKRAREAVLLLLAPLVSASTGMVHAGSPAPTPRGPAALEAAAVQAGLDQRVEAFLESNRRSWRDANVPAVDGQKLFDLIVEHGYTRAVEVGTSTGHSGIWIAWAMGKITSYDCSS